MSNTITISRSSNSSYRQVKINSDWYEGSEFFTVKTSDGFMSITKHYLDVPAKAYKSIRGYFHFPTDIPLGKFEIDEEESNEDELIIYFE